MTWRRRRRRPGGLRVAAAALAVAVGVGACTGDDGGEPTTTAPPADAGPVAGGVLRIGLPGPVLAEPAAASPAEPADLLVADLLWDGLTRLADDGSAAPALATGWEVDDGGTTWRFELDDAATFGDGEPITAEEVVASLTRVAAAGESSLAATRLEVVTGWAELAGGEAERLAGLMAGDDGTVEVHLDEPFPALAQLLAGPLYGIAPAPGSDETDDEADEPAAEADEAGRDDADDSAADDPGADDPETDEAGAGEDDQAPGPPITSGGWALTTAPGGVARLTPGAGIEVYVDAIELHPYDDAEAAWEALEAGDVDWAPVPADADDPPAGVVVADAPFQAAVLLALPADAEPLDQRAVRQAIAAAIDQESVAEAYGGRADPLADLVPAGVPGHDAASCELRCPADVDAATELLADLDDEVATVEIAHEDTAVQRDLVAALVEQLDAAGIAADAVAHDPDDYAGLVAAGELGAFVTAWIGLYPSPDAHLVPLLRSGSADNVVGVADERLDGLLDAARGDGDAADLDLEAWDAAGQRARNLAVLVPLAQLHTRIGLDERVQGVAPRVDGTVDLAAVWLVPAPGD